jgi:hypothetical protein
VPADASQGTIDAMATSAAGAAAQAAADTLGVPVVAGVVAAQVEGSGGPGESTGQRVWAASGCAVHQGSVTVVDRAMLLNGGRPRAHCSISE